MAINPINVGAAPDDGTGDALRDAFTKVNANEASLDARVDERVVIADGLVVVKHGASAGAARPASAGVVYWLGSVSPTNQVVGDLWFETSEFD